MKLSFPLPLLGLSVCAALATTGAQAEPRAFKGSDTLGGVMADAIAGAGLSDALVYTGGGSTLGERALVAAEQGLAPMSRAFKDQALADARAAGIEPRAHVIALDGIGVFVNAGIRLPAIDMATLKKVYTCEITAWEDIPRSGRRGAIKAYRRDDNSGTTDAFKSLVGVQTFGACVTVLDHADDVSRVTVEDAAAMGYAGLSSARDGNRALGVAKTATDTPVQPSVDTIRAKTYPLSRELYVYEASGAATPTAAEAALLGRLLDRSFIDPILAAHDFFTID